MDFLFTKSAGIVALLFCGITLKHYAYYNMSRKTQLTTKYTFQVLAQLSENFIFIYLGLTLLAEDTLVFKPLFIMITVVAICISRYAAVFPLSKLINWFIRYRAKRRGQEAADELPHSYQVMLFWAGLRGAVGVALAASLAGPNAKALQATVLVVVVLTVIIFGGTTARMLEIMGIRTGVVEEIDSDDEFDIESASNGTYYRRAGVGVGHTPIRSDHAVPLDKVDIRSNGANVGGFTSYSSAHQASPPVRPTSANASRKNSTLNGRERDAAQQNLLSKDSSTPSEDEDLYSDSDLPPAAPRRSPKRNASPPPDGDYTGRSLYPTSGSGPPTAASETHLTTTGAIREFFSSTSEDHAAWFKQLDEGFIKPKLLLDQGNKGGGGPSGHGGGHGGAG